MIKFPKICMFYIIKLLTKVILYLNNPEYNMQVKAVELEVDCPIRNSKIFVYHFPCLLRG